MGVITKSESIRMGRKSQKGAIIAGIVSTSIVWVVWLVCRLVFGGQCNPRPDMLPQDFDRAEYLGRWYEMFRDKDIPFETDECVTATYTDDGNNIIGGDNRQYDITETKANSAQGEAQCSFWRPGLCGVRFFIMAPWASY